jgi:hypothetical protein
MHSGAVSELVGSLGETVCKLRRELERLVLADLVFDPEVARNRQSTRRATSCRAGIDMNARVSSLKPTVL